MKELNARLKAGRIDKAYIFSGAEPYLIRAYEKRLRAAALGDAGDMNAAVFEGTVLTDDIFTAAETLPFLSTKRLVILRNCGLLQPGKKDASDALADYIPNMPETASLVFIETIKPPDKRGRLYKKIAETGLPVDFATPSEAELTTWLSKLFQSEGLTLSKGTALTLLRRINGNDGIMDALYSEAMKLVSYMGGRAEVTAADVETVCSQSVEGRVFDLVKELASRNIKALSSFNALLAMKEQPLGILSMIARQFRLILVCSGLKSQGLSSAEIAKRAGVRDFMAADFIRQSAGFSASDLTGALSDCLTAEYNVKTGLMPDRMAVESLIVKYCGGNSLNRSLNIGKTITF